MALEAIWFVLLLLTLVLELWRGASISGCIADERDALLNLKKNVKDKHNRLASWKGDEDCCNWEGVSCNNVTGHVIKLDLRNPYPCDFFQYDDNFQCHNWSLRGQLSPSLLRVKQLHYLDLSVNHFDGPIPKFLGSLHNLRYLNLSLAGFHGLIPHHLGNLSRLKYLDLNNNINWNDYGYLCDAGTDAIIDDSRWISGLTSLKHLTVKNIKFENFQNWIEALNELPNIAEICLSFCDINIFPLSLPYVNFTNLSYLDLSYNDLEVIPLWLFNIKSITHIHLSDNHFKSIPDALKNLTSLEYIDFSSNQFSGALPQALKSLTSLKYIDFSFNEFSGALPQALKSPRKLHTLDLTHNSIDGSLPSWLGELVALQQLRLSHNKLNGTIPESIGQLSNLVSLYLNGNSFWGVISETHFATLAKLKKLSLCSNNLILNVSHDWIPPFKLNEISMCSCKIGPEFPPWLQTQVNLSYLDLSSSDIVDFLPNWFWDVFATHTYVGLDLSDNGITGSLPHLSKLCFNYFNLSSNFFSGHLPSTFNTSGFFDISNNSFYGPISPFICSTIQFYDMSLSTNKFGNVLDFSLNLFTGELPNCWGSSNAIFFLDFSMNNLAGNIPHTLGNLTKLISLYLNNNNISGNIPSTLGNCTSLRTLDLSFNNIKGQIPLWIGEKLISLEALLLESNNFTGNVPTNLWKLKYLRILNLGNNHLFGAIPRSIGNFTSMMDVYQGSELFSGYDSLQLIIKGRGWMYRELLSLITNIDLSCNELSGQVPIDIVNLKGLKYLNLSENHLVGLIPDEIGWMQSLESLDMSRNGLSGNIPLSMSTMTTLNSLNLSYNNLSGSIPLGNQLQTLTNESYIGNPQLCGFPLAQPCDSNKTTTVEVSVDEGTKSDYWYVSVAFGFVFGSWIVWGTFFLKKKWEGAFFRYVDYVYDAIYVAITVNKNRLKRKLGIEVASG